MRQAGAKPHTPWSRLPTPRRLPPSETRQEMRKRVYSFKPAAEALGSARPHREKKVSGASPWGVRAKRGKETGSTSYGRPPRLPARP